jgi:hypothetical protein
MSGKKGGTDDKPKLFTAGMAQLILWFVGLAVLFLYAWGLYAERTAPIQPVTGFHVSVAGAWVNLLFPVAVVLQSMLLMGGFALLIVGMIGDRKWTLPGLGLFSLGLGFMGVNYLISQY